MKEIVTITCPVLHTNTTVNPVTEHSTHLPQWRHILIHRGNMVETYWKQKQALFLGSKRFYLLNHLQYFPCFTTVLLIERLRLDKIKKQSLCWSTFFASMAVVSFISGNSELPHSYQYQSRQARFYCQTCLLWYFEYIQLIILTLLK